MTWIRKQKLDSDWSGPADKKYVHIKCIWSKTTVKITVKLQQIGGNILFYKRLSTESIQAMQIKLSTKYHLKIMGLIVYVLAHYPN